MTIVRFIRGGYRAYIVGDVAGFPEVEAEKILECGYAERLDEIENPGADPPAREFAFKTEKQPPKFDNFICPICGKKHTQETDLAKHLEKKHNIK